jgi:hypothetical protein
LELLFAAPNLYSPYRVSHFTNTPHSKRLLLLSAFWAGRITIIRLNDEQVIYN